MRQPETIRRDLTERLGTAAVTDRMWNYLSEQGDVAELESGRRDLNWLVDRILRVLEASGKSEAVFKPKPPMLAKPTRIGDRMMVLSKLLAKDAATRDDVTHFRKQVLGERFLPPGQVEAWITARREEGLKPPAGMRLMIEAPGRLARDTRNPSKLKRPLVVREYIESGWDELHYATPDSRYVKSVATPARSGPLAELRQISETLASAYDWQKAQATLFVLTGQPPLLSAFRWSITPRESAATRRGARRITLDVDLTLSPKDVAARYAAVRRRLQPEKARRRELGEKHLTLAYFLADHEDLPWAESLRLWNAGYSLWKYGHESNFRRDALRATERVLTPEVGADAINRAHWPADENTERKPLKRTTKRKRGAR